MGNTMLIAIGLAFVLLIIFFVLSSRSGDRRAHNSYTDSGSSTGGWFDSGSSDSGDGDSGGGGD